MIVSALFCRRSLDKHAKGRVAPLQNITVILTKFPFVRLQRFKHMILFGNINKGIEEYKSAPGALLVDVREADEFQRGHIPGAVNEPLSGIAHTALPKDKPLYLYCLRGTRSRRAARILKKMGYTAKSIGGISNYRGTVER